MKNENDKVRAFAMEVIEMINDRILYAKDDGREIKDLCWLENKLKATVESLLPKEEEVDCTCTTMIACTDCTKNCKDILLEPETKTESDEVKVGDSVEARDYVDRENEWNNDLFYMGVKTKQGLFVCEDSDGRVYPFDEIRKVYQEPTLEQKARKKAEEICKSTAGMGISKTQLIEALLIDPKTL